MRGFLYFKNLCLKILKLNAETKNDVPEFFPELLKFNKNARIKRTKGIIL